VRGRLIALSLLAGTGAIVPMSSAFASPANRPATPTGSIGIRLVGVPGASLNDPLASSYVVDRMAPGTRLTRSVEIDNNSGASVVVTVYPAAASIVRGGYGFAPGNSANELSSWTSLTHDVLRLAPGGEAFDTLTINVPGSASSGERYAVVWAEVSAPPTAAGGITLVNRVGVRMYLSIGPGGAPASNFTIGSLAAERSVTGEALVVAKVHNSGQSTLDLSGSLTLSKGPGGLRTDPFAATLGTVLAPGVSEPVTVQLTSEVPRGPWRADLSLTSGLVQRSAVATITFPLNSHGAKSPKSTGFPTLILVVIVLFFLLAMTAVALLLSRRRISRVL
jgi:hypothetical protein